MEEELKGLKSTSSIILVGNKQDLTQKCVTQEEIQQIVEKYKIRYYEVSAKNNVKIEEMFLGLVNQIKPRIERKGSAPLDFKSKGIIFMRIK